MKNFENLINVKNENDNILKAVNGINKDLLFLNKAFFVFVSEDEKEYKENAKELIRIYNIYAIRFNNEYSDLDYELNIPTFISEYKMGIINPKYAFDIISYQVDILTDLLKGNIDDFYDNIN